MVVKELWSRLRRPSEGIVTLADAAYFPGLELLYASARESYPVPIHCFDVGLSEEQKTLARERYPGLTIRPVPDVPIISAIRERLGAGSPITKPGKRAWPLWICPVLIAASPFRRVLWLDCDIAVLRDLRGLFALLDDGPVFTPENFAPEATPNKPELYRLLPIEREYDPAVPTVNGGVSGWDVVRDREVLEAYLYPVRRACEDARVLASISWHDQGALIWAIQRSGMEHRVAESWKWNLCVRHTRVFHGDYPWGDGFLEAIRRDVPEANLLHWNGQRVPWSAIRALYADP